DVAKDAWTANLPLMPQAVHHAAIATDGSSLFVIGGLVGILSFQPLDSTYRYDPVTKQWFEMAHLNDFRGGGAGVSDGSRIWFIGGLSSSGPSNAVEIYDIKGNAWTAGRSMPTARDGIAAALVGRKIYVMGGERGTSTANMDTVEIYDIDKDSWSA